MFIILLFIGLGIILCYFKICKKNISLQEQTLESIPAEKFNGLVLFDVDETLTTGTDNENVVQTVLDRGWAVGICTSGKYYTMENIKKFPWMPKNLWEFIRKYNDITFNNVGSGILMGKYQLDIYKNLTTQIPYGTDIYGFRKGYTLEQNSIALGIKNPNCMIICDDLITFIQGVKKYNPKLITMCSGTNCGGELSVNNIQKAMNFCNKK